MVVFVNGIPERILCSCCGFTIPDGETFDPTFPVCDGCKGFADDDDMEEVFHLLVTLNGVPVKFVCNEHVIEFEEDDEIPVFNYCQFCGMKLDMVSVTL